MLQCHAEKIFSLIKTSITLSTLVAMLTACAGFGTRSEKIDFTGNYVEHVDSKKLGFAGEILSITGNEYVHQRIPTEPCAEEGPYYECGERFEYGSDSFQQCVNALVNQQDFLLECAELEPPFGEYKGRCEIEGNRITFLKSFLSEPTRYLVTHKGKRYLLTQVQYLKFQLNGTPPSKALREI